jgi:ApbE superfamily uncharacterized protein (UPF0280 family)
MGNERWKSFRVEHLETDLWIAVSSDRYTLQTELFAHEKTVLYRNILNNHIRIHPEFLTSLVPLQEIPGVHDLITAMYRAALLSGTGPMSAVAGAVAECICNDLIDEFGFQEAVVENGGDIFMKLQIPSTISVYAGSSPLCDKIGLIIKPEETPISVCCSSATVGHSLSFGSADACVIACKSGALADAYATACCNEIKDAGMIQQVTDSFLEKSGILSVVIIKDDKVGIGGSLEVTVLH